KKLSLELGGNAPCLVFDDADLERAVDGAMLAKFRNTGQSCIAANRIYVQAGIYDRFVAAFVEQTKALKVGNGLEGEQDVGPVVNEKGLRFALDQIEEAKHRGARVLAGGKHSGWGRELGSEGLDAFLETKHISIGVNA